LVISAVSARGRAILCDGLFSKAVRDNNYQRSSAQTLWTLHAIWG
jgi:hypothetical protein